MLLSLTFLLFKILIINIHIFRHLKYILAECEESKDTGKIEKKRK